MDAPTYARRRAALIDRLDGATLVIGASRMSLRNADVEHEFRQDSDFHYLTGLNEPGAVAVICPGHPEHRYTLFVRGRDPAAEVWTGPRPGPEGAVADHGADAAFDLAELDTRLPDLIGRSERLAMALGRDQGLERTVWSAGDRAARKWKEGLVRPTLVEDVSRSLHELRLRKDGDEIDAMRKAAAITVEGHRRAMEVARPGLFEWEVQAELEAVFRRAGARRNAYESIVASGPNATYLHYVANDRALAEGDLLLIDAGAEWRMYAADVTRTFPVGARFSGPQRALYELVLSAHRAAIDRCRPGVERSATHDVAVRVLTEGMIELGLLKGDAEELIAEEEHKRYFMHGTGHWLGMDVHDAGRYSLFATDGPESRPFEPGMVTTIEPGLYIAPDDEEAPAIFRGLGVRIEDDVLITEDGFEVLTEALPTAADDVEALVRG